MIYGICNVVCAQLMKEPGHKGELHTQLLRGDKVKVLEKQGGFWISILTRDGQITGWTLESQFTEISETAYYLAPEFILIGNEYSDFPGLQQLNLHGTIVAKPGELQQIVKLNSILFNDHTKTKILQVYAETPYLWGGCTHLGIDCSGLSRMFYRFFGVFLPHHAVSQMESGLAVDFLSGAQYGDLAFFQQLNGVVNHVGILINDHQVMHASESNGKVATDLIDQQGIINTSTGRRTHDLRIIKRLL